MKTTPAKRVKFQISLLTVFAFVAITGGSVKADPPGYGNPGRGPRHIPREPRWPEPPRHGPGYGPGGRPGDTNPGGPRFPEPPRGGPRRPLPVGRPIFVRPSVSGNEDEIRAVRIFQAATQEARC